MEAEIPLGKRIPVSLLRAKCHLDRFFSQYFAFPLYHSTNAPYSSSSQHHCYQKDESTKLGKPSNKAMLLLISRGIAKRSTSTLTNVNNSASLAARQVSPPPFHLRAATDPLSLSLCYRRTDDTQSPENNHRRSSSYAKSAHAGT